MYRLIDTLARDNASNAPWVEVDLFDESIQNAPNEYKEIVLVLESIVDNVVFSFNFTQEYQNFDFGVRDITFNTFVGLLAGLNINRMDYTPKIDKRQIQWFDVFRSGYDVDLTDLKQNHTSIVSESSKKDLRVFKEGLDHKQMFDNCLITINGLLHRTNYMTDYVGVIDGASTLRVSNKNQVGAIYFGEVGKVKQISIKPQHISSLNDFGDLADGLVLKVDATPEELKDKTVMLSIGGFLHYPGDGTVSRVGDGVYSVKPKLQNWIKRFFYLRETLCTSCLDKELGRSSFNKSLVAVSEIYSDEFVKMLMLLNNSFFVLVDAKNLTFEYSYPEFSKLPGRYVTYQKPTLPLITGLGSISEYHYKKEYDRYAVNAPDTLISNYVFETQELDDTDLVDDKKVTTDPIKYTKGKFLNIYTNG